jgi:lactoylglutathione lyase
MADIGASFAFTKIIVRDVAGAVDFYGKVLGLTVVRTVEFPHLVEKLLAAPGQEAGPFLILYHEYAGGPLKHGNAWGPVGYQVADVDATYAAALAAGGKADMEPFNFEDVRVAMVFDPEDHRIELMGAPGSAKA